MESKKEYQYFSTLEIMSYLQCNSKVPKQKYKKISGLSKMGPETFKDFHL